MRSFKVVFVNLTTREFKGTTPNYSFTYLTSYYHSHGKNTSRVSFGLVDENIDDGRTVEHIVREKPDIVGISSTSMFIHRASETARSIRKRLPNTKIIGGGVHFHLEPAYLLREKVFDYCCGGEGEKTFCQFLDLFIETDGSPQVEALSKIKGLNFFDGHHIHQSDPDLVEANEIPDPDLTLLNQSFYFERNYHFGRYHIGRMATLYTSRGCPFACAFCYNNLLNHKVRYLSADKVIHQIKTFIARFNTRYFSFGDDLFMGNRNRVIDICTRLLDENINIRWACNGRAELIQKDNGEILELMKKAGCEQIQFGFESGSDSILKMLKGPSASVAKNQDAIDIVVSHGINVMGYFMVGVPHETREDLEATREFISQNQKKMLFWEVFIFTPVPGTSLWKICEEQGLLNNMDLTRIAANMFCDDIQTIRLFNRNIPPADILSVRRDLKYMLYETINIWTKLLWAISNFRQRPSLVFKRIGNYLAGSPGKVNRLNFYPKISVKSNCESKALWKGSHE